MQQGQRKTLVRWIGGTIIGALWLLAAAGLILATVEWGGIARMYLDSASRTAVLPLHKTDYFGSPREEDPYKPFVVQHLNPFHLFSLPWQPEDIAAANNDVVTVDATGYRITPSEPGGKPIGVLLGGSVAFGDGASSDTTTIAARMTAKGSLHWMNRNAPSWNSFQELTSLARVRETYQVSLSFSLMNDIIVFCRNNDSGARFAPDTPESFDALLAIANDIRGSSKRSFFDRWVGSTFERMFPDVTAAYGLWKEGGSRDKKRKRSEFDCKNADAVIESYLHNQSVMRRMSEAAGARHVVVLQPLYGLHATSRPELRRYTEGEYAFRKEVAGRIMASEFCRKDCVDLTTVFDTAGGASTILENAGTKYEPRIFKDEVHLTDQGVEIVSTKILEALGVPSN